MNQLSSGDPIEDTSTSFMGQHYAKIERTETETTNLEQSLGVPYNIKESTPPCHLRLACATYHYVQRGIEVIQKFDYSREDSTRWVRLDILQVRLRLHNGVQKDLKRVSEEGQFSVVRSEGDGIFYVVGFEVVQEDMVQEEVGLHCIQQGKKRRYFRMYEHLWTVGTSQRAGSFSQPLRSPLQ